MKNIIEKFILVLCCVFGGVSFLWAAFVTYGVVRGALACMINIDPDGWPRFGKPEWFFLCSVALTTLILGLRLIVDRFRWLKILAHVVLGVMAITALACVIFVVPESYPQYLHEAGFIWLGISILFAFALWGKNGVPVPCWT